ncbi:MAG: iron ABC transporter permease [Ilumatobacteraceae bacterium]
MDRALERRRAPLNGLPRWFVAAVAVPPAAFLLLFYVWPFVTLLARGLGGADVAATLSRSDTWRILWFTTWQATASTALTIVIGLAPTWAVSRFDFAFRRVFVSTLTAVFVLPTVVVGAAFLAVLPDALDRSIWAILGAHVAFNLAVVVRTVGSAWERLPSDLDHAAAALGAGPFTTFRLITLPLLRSSISASAAIVFLFTFTSFGVIRVLGTAGRPTIEVEVWRRATQLGDIGGAATLTILQLLALGGLVAWTTVQQRRHAIAIRGEAPRRRPRPVGRQIAHVTGAVGVTTLIVAAPLLALVERSLRSGDGYSLAAWRSLGNNEIRPGLRLGVDPLGALQRSATTAVWATLFAMVIGATAVVAISALGRTGKVLDAGLMLPLGTSAITIGFGMLITFDTPPVDWRAEWWLVPIGHALVATPFVVRSALSVVRTIPADRAAAAATLGASPVRAWANTTLPALRRPFAAAAGLAAAISLGEFGATSFLTRSGSDTLPIAIERLLGRTGRLFQAQAFALSTILAVATIGIVLLVDRGGDRARRS